MKRILLLIILLITSAQTIHSQTVVLDANGVTVKWTGTTVPSPYFVQANPRGTGMEWFAIVNNSTKVNITNYAKNIQSGITFFTPPNSTTPIPFNNIVTTLVTDMSYMFTYYTGSILTNSPLIFNQNIGSWDVSNVTNMSYMFKYAEAFNQNIGSWNVSNVTNMSYMFDTAADFNQPIENWNVSRVTNMSGMFGVALDFNQPISSWNVSNVTDMSFMFSGADAFNQPLGSWNVSNVTKMKSMFRNNNAFNQNIGSWNVSRVTDMSYMFSSADFNQNIGSWNVINVTDMSNMFWFAAFNQPIGAWNVSNVTNMSHMFSNSSAFNQNIGSWNVSRVTDMSYMFDRAAAFNQNIGSWNVSNVNTMLLMFNGVQLSTANYDALLIGWATISPNETPLIPNVVFSGGNSKYCNGASARNILDFTPPNNWTITDGGLDCSSLDTETFETNTLKLYPNPVISVLNVKKDNSLINQPYTIIDGLGRVVLNGKLIDVDSTINVEQLSKGIYYLKIAGNNVNKFIKE